MMDVKGMKQVRWPGVNHARLGGVFTDENNRVTGTFIMNVSHAYFDFLTGDYLFCDVPGGSKWFYFTSFRDIKDIECLAVDSSNIEAIEPEWTEHEVGDNDSLVGIYPVTTDGMKRARSLSGNVTAKVGNNVSSTSGEWKYDSEGNPIEAPKGSLNYTFKDFQNLCRLREDGYQLIDYEQNKEISNLWWALSGTTNEQALVGNGGFGSNLNKLDNIGMADSKNTGNSLNSIMGLKGYVGCQSEWMDNIAINVSNYEQFYKARCPENDSSYPSDYTAHIYDPIKKTERTVMTANSANGHNIVRLVHGAKCDILPRRVHASDTSMFVTNYAAGFWINSSKGRCVLRSGNNSNAYSGLAYAYANNASSYSNTNYGGRLAFRGKFVIIE